MDTLSTAALQSFPMQRPRPLMPRYRNATSKPWLGVAFAVVLLLAEAFGVAHQYDAAAHSNEQVCAVCVSVASFGAANVGAAFQLEPAVAASFIPVAARIVVRSVVPTRRYARGPPPVSFKR
jgi:hypothetical protein